LQSKYPQVFFGAIVALKLFTDAVMCFLQWVKLIMSGILLQQRWQRPFFLPRVPQGDHYEFATQIKPNQLTGAESDHCAEGDA